MLYIVLQNVKFVFALKFKEMKGKPKEETSWNARGTVDSFTIMFYKTVQD